MLCEQAFRKEAIWREMRDYKRQATRAQDAVAALEKDKRDYQARLSVVDLSWSALVQEATLLLPSTSAGSAAPSGQSSLGASWLSDSTVS